MGLNKQIVYMSDIDEGRFGIRIAKSFEVTADNLPEIIDFCRDNNVKMLIARCPANDFSTIHAMEKEGFLLMDTLVYLNAPKLSGKRERTATSFSEAKWTNIPGLTLDHHFYLRR